MIWLITAPAFPARSVSRDQARQQTALPEGTLPEQNDASLNHPEARTPALEPGNTSPSNAANEFDSANCHPEEFPPSSEHEIILSAFEAGLQTLLLRKPGWTESAYARWIEHLPAQHRAKVIVSTFPALVEAFGLKGVHLSEEARAKTAPFEIRKLRETGKWVSTSIHHESTDIAGFDFVMTGPLFDSISKPGYHAQPFRTIPANAIAVGGIHAGNIRDAREKGFRGAAVLGAVWQAPESVSEIISGLIKAWPASTESIHRFKPGI